VSVTTTMSYREVNTQPHCHSPHSILVWRERERERERERVVVFCVLFLVLYPIPSSLSIYSYPPSPPHPPTHTFIVCAKPRVSSISNTRALRLGLMSCKNDNTAMNR
jgi:hypothetical protein